MSGRDRRVPAAARVASRRRWPILAVGLFVLSRGLYLALGVRFDATPLADYWQYLDPVLLRDDLLRSLVYLHSQPPLFNLGLGLVLKAAPTAYAVVFAALYFLVGLALYLATTALMVRLGVAPSWALGLAGLFSLAPIGVLYESWLFYTLPLTLVLTGSALLLDGVLRRPSGGRLVAFFIAILVLCATASPFHLVFYLGVTGLVLASVPARGRVILAALVPSLALLGLYASHAALFSRFDTQSWVGMSAAKVVLRHVPVDDRRRWMADGTVSPLALITPFSALDAYPPAWRRTPPGTPDLPVLRAALKSTGATNYNHVAYLGIADTYGHDTRVAIGRVPRALFEGVGTAWAYYLRAGSDYPFFGTNRGALEPLVSLVERTVYLRAPAPFAYALEPGDRSDWAWSVVLGLPLVVGWAAGRAWHGRQATDSDTRRRAWVLAYVVAVILYVAVVGNSLEVVENNRFRVMTEPFAWLLLATWLASWWGQRAGRASARQASRRS